MYDLMGRVCPQARAASNKAKNSTRPNVPPVTAISIAGGYGSLKREGPEKTVGSYWPFASTIFDYIKRAMPYGNARSLSDDEVYAVTAYVLYLNDVVKEEFELSKDNFTSITLSNADGFHDDDRETTEKQFWKNEPCMTNCKAEPPKILNRARMLDVTPDAKTGPRVE
jgi:S-disulfanyl-L-cysteine oxidoreductase SoxD